MIGGESGGRALLLVSHTTRLAYAEPVVEAHSEIRKTPVDTGLQRLITHKLEVEPAAPLFSYRDYFGTHVHAVNLLEPHRELAIHAEAVVETTDAICCGPSACDDERPWQQRLAEFLHWSPAVPPLEAYQTIRHGVRLELDGDTFLARLRELGGLFETRFRYDASATDVHSSPEVLFRAGGGVCQDFAHAMTGVLRLARVPARYVSGYVYDPGGDDAGVRLRGDPASHAWVQVWHPELGWVGIDPTHDRFVDWQYVRVAVGRDYTDVQPLRGVFVGTGEQRLEVEVEVERIG